MENNKPLSKMIKVTYNLQIGRSNGFDMVWTTRLEIYDASTAEQLNKEIDNFISFKDGGCRRNISIKSVEAL